MLIDLGPKGMMPMTSDRIHSPPPEGKLSSLRGQAPELCPLRGGEDGRDQLESGFEVGDYRELFEHSLSGYSLHQVVFDDERNLRDLILLEVNRSFEAITGLPASQVVGRRITETMPGIDLRHLRDAMAWLETGDQEPYRFEQFVEVLAQCVDLAGDCDDVGGFGVYRFLYLEQ